MLLFLLSFDQGKKISSKRSIMKLHLAVKREVEVGKTLESRDLTIPEAVQLMQRQGSKGLMRAGGPERKDTL